MNATGKVCSGFIALLLLAQVSAHAQVGRSLPPVEQQPVVQPGKDDPKQKDKDKQPDKDKKAEPPQTDVFSRVLVPRTEAPAGYNPHMLGDWSNKFARQQLAITGSQTINIKSPLGATIATATTPVTQTRQVLVPLPNQGPFKVAENASPRPQDRVFGFYNFYADVRGPDGGGNGPIVTTVVNPIIRGNGQVVTTTTTLPGGPYQHLHREIFGFEKTFLDGNASIEVRIPVMQQIGNAGIGSYDHLGDLTIVTKYALINNLDTGNVLSGGLAITAPTSPTIRTTAGDFHAVLLQPWFGYICNRDRFFVQGFHSVVVPTDNRDVTLLFNDVGLSYWLYRGERGGLVRFIVPTVEAHITTPLNRRSIDTDPIVVTDAVVFTGGIHIGLGRGSTLTFGAATPVTGARPYSVEAFLQYNLRF